MRSWWHTIERSGENWRRRPEDVPSIEVIEPGQPMPKENAVPFGFSRVLQSPKKERKKVKKKAKGQGRRLS